jgi:hypothetical protein
MLLKTQLPQQAKPVIDPRILLAEPIFPNGISPSANLPRNVRIGAKVAVRDEAMVRKWLGVSGLRVECSSVSTS